MSVSRQFRRNIIKALVGDATTVEALADEFDFCENATYESPKNYQVWLAKSGA